MSNRAIIRLVKGKGVKCPICGIDHGCAIFADGSGAICLRVEQGCAKDRKRQPIKAKNGMGWLHRTTGKPSPSPGMRAAKSAPKLSRAEITALLKNHQTAVDPQKLDKFSKSIGISVRALKAYGVGWDNRSGCWSFPMYDGERKPIGIHLRSSDGQKRCVPGSKLGLFIPSDYDPRPIPSELSGKEDDCMPWLLVLPEGLTDACAAYDMGLVAIGRPSNVAGIPMVKDLLKSLPKQIVVAIADKDNTKYLPDGTPHWPGIEGAIELAAKILADAGQARFMMPPDGAKDIREWVKSGGERARLLAEVMCAPRVSEEWLRKARQRLKDKKAREFRRQPAA